MQRYLGAVLLAVLLGFAGSASAKGDVYPQLTSIKGGVFIDAGKGFAPIKPAPAESAVVILKTGDRVMVAKGGSAVLSLGPDCSVPLESPSMTTVAEAACVVGTQDGGGGGGGGAGNFAAFAGGSLLTPFVSIANGIGETDEGSPVSP